MRIATTILSLVLMVVVGTDLTIWGVVALVLAALSFLGAREKRRQRGQSRSRVA